MQGSSTLELTLMGQSNQELLEVCINQNDLTNFRQHPVDYDNVILQDSLIRLLVSGQRDEMLISMINYGYNVDRPLMDGWNPLTIATQHNQQGVVTILLGQAHVNPNQLSPEGTALHIAARNGFNKIVDQLLRHKYINVEVLFQGKTALEVADPSTKQLVTQFVDRMSTMRTSITSYAQLRKLVESQPKSPTVMGRVYKVNYLKVFHYQRFIVIDPENGVLSRYKMNSNTEFKKCESIQLKLIDDVRVSVGGWYHRTGFYYVVLTYQSDKQIRFGVSQLSIAEQWVQMIKQCIKYSNNICECVDHQCQLQQCVEEIIIDDDIIIDNKYKTNISLQDLNAFECIGKGSFGCVYKVEYLGKLYALKQQEKFKLISTNNLKYALSEASILKQIYHPFLVNCVSCFQTNGNLYILMEYCDGGDLAQYMTRGVIWPAIQAKLYIAEIILAIEYLHSKNIIYRDLKPENIAIDSTGHIKLLDFNQQDSEFLLVDPSINNPEECTLNKAIQIFQLGSILYQMLTGEIFNNGNKLNMKMTHLMSKSASKLLKRMLNKELCKRPTLKQVKNDSYFKGIDWLSVEARRCNTTLQVQQKPNISEIVVIADDNNNDILEGWNFQR